MTRKTIPYGTWPSPVTAEMVAGKSLRFGAIQHDAGAIYWSEGRPDEGGRGALMRAEPGADPTEILPAPWSARSRVHEYGGGEFLVNNGRIFFVEAESQDLFELTPGDEPRRLTAHPDMRFADMNLDVGRNRLISVSELFEEGSHLPENFIVSVDLNAEPEEAVSIIAEGHDFFVAPRISPDGKSLVWLSWDLPEMPWDRATLYRASFDERGMLGEPEKMAGGDGSAVFQPGWLGDGRLAFVWDTDGWGRLYVSDADDTVPISPEGQELMRPQWVFGMQSWVELQESQVAAAFFDNGALKVRTIDLEAGTVSDIDTNLRSVDALAPFGSGLAMIGASDTDAPAVVSVTNGVTETIRSAGESGLTPDDISVGDLITFEGEAGPVHALWYPPTSSSCVAPNDERPPVIVMVHGGPTGMADRGLKLKIQYWTSRGFAVCDLDYSGSAGYGRAYRDRLNGKWGVLDLSDVEALASHLVSANLADPKRLLISGGSAGGYTVLMALARLDLFAAGACSYGVSDLAQLQRITHKFEAGYLYGLTGTTQETCEPVFADRSPTTHADGITCPVIFFQGLEDKVVPPAQSRVMAQSLRERGVPLAEFEFEGEGHGFRMAETITAVLELEYAFYARILGLDADDQLPDIEIENF